MNNDFARLRIGYVPYSVYLSRPGDRRRFCYYANKRNIKFEIADPFKDYDIVVVTQKGDLGVWSNYRKGKAKIVYDFIDSYLAIPRYDLKGILRGLAKVVAGENRYLKLNYWKAIEQMCQRSDAVICSTEEQKQDISKFCKNVHIVLDFHSSVVQEVKQDYSCRDIFNFVWEGLPCNIRSFYEINDVLMKLSEKKKVALHIVTDLEYYKYAGRYGHQQTSALTKKLSCDVHLHEWNEKTCSDLIRKCDLALIPISLNDSFAVGKPENKLLLFWRMGMPVVVSSTPAYERAMQQCGLSMTCRTKSEWIETLVKYIDDENARREAGARGLIFAEKYYSEEIILDRWDKVFLSLV
ncbi:MAG TPA: hypothetical protein PKO44_06530 [Candidatus Omnitrophota bacterium]|nr:hypothetical protein [Candidatus Omnitrophota bacterium]